jgi:hypothetical protein
MSGAAAFKRAGAIQLDPQTTQSTRIKTSAFLHEQGLKSRSPNSGKTSTDLIASFRSHLRVSRVLRAFSLR